MVNNILNYDGFLNSVSLEDFFLKLKFRYFPLLKEELYFQEEISAKNFKAWISNIDNKGITPAFKYINNKYGFRDIDTEFQSDVFFFGCSVTYGIGVPYQLRFSEIVKENLNLKINNFGISGIGTTDILALFLGTTKFLKPKTCVFLIPDIHREIFSKIDDDGNIEFFNGFSNFTKHLSKVQYPAEYDICTNYYNLPVSYRLDKFINNIHSILILAEIKNINIIIGSWDKVAHDILSNIKIDNFKNTILIDYVEKDKLGRDLSHPGILFHKKLATKIIKAIKNDTEHS